jgi:hypothetical protein
MAIMIAVAVTVPDLPLSDVQRQARRACWPFGVLRHRCTCASTCLTWRTLTRAMRPLNSLVALAPRPAGEYEDVIARLPHLTSGAATWDS